MTRKITKDLVKAFYKYMLNRFDVTLVTKESHEIRIIRNILRLMRIKAIESFLDNCGFAFGDDDALVYMPFRVGEFSTSGEGMVQIASLCHELQHIHQNRTEGGNQIKYLMRRGHRAFQEAEAIHVEMELWHWWRPKLGFNIVSVAQRLKFYMLRPVDIEVVKKQLTMAKRDVERGMIVHQVSKVGIRKLINLTK